MNNSDRGRPRDPTVDQAILEATQKVLIADGYEKLSIEGVAREAGVGKASIYRRWGSKTELVLAATISLVPEIRPGDDPGQALASLIDTVCRDFERPALRAALPGLVSECLRDPARINSDRLDPEIEVVATALGRRPDQEPAPDPSLVFDIYAGAALVRLLRGAPLSPPFRRDLHRVLVDGLGL